MKARWLPEFVLKALVVAAGLATAGCESCSEAPGGPTEVDCRIGAGGGSCRLEGCLLLLPPGALADWTDFTMAIEPPADPALAAELVGGRECVVGPEGVTFAVPGDLRMSYADGEIPPNYGAGEIIAVEERASALYLVTPYLPEVAEVAMSVAAAGRFGMSFSPDGPDARVVLGAERIDVADDASFLRNVASNHIWAAFWDGERLFVGSGARLLVWRGMPVSAAERPDYVLGRPSLLDNPTMASASNFAGAVSGIWSDGTRLAVATGNRVRTQ